VGETLQFTASGGSGTFEWSISNNQLARISASGLLTALTQGQVSVTATDPVNNLVSDPVVVDITPIEIQPGNIRQATVGQSINFSISGGIGPFNWAVINPLTSGPTGVARVAIDPSNSRNVQVTTNTEGSFQLRAIDTAPASQISTTTPTIDVSAAAPVPVDPVTITPPGQNTLTVGSTLQLTATGGVPPYSWRTQDLSRVQVDSRGLITAVFPTTVPVEVVVSDSTGATASESFTVNASPLAVSNSGSVIWVGNANSVTLTANGGVEPYTWTETTNGLLSLDPNTGVAAAVAPGIATVQVTDSAGATATGTVDVRQVSITNAPLSAVAGDPAVSLTASGVAPLTWAVDDATGTIATIDASGLFTPVGAGTVVITVTDANGNTASATTTITAPAAAAGGHGGRH
jgi:hypothetical protein